MLKSIVTSFTLLLFMSSLSIAQDFKCENWNNSPKKDDGEGAHSIYRSALKAKDFDMAFEHWQMAYSIAPGADGKRDFHLTDGIKIYTHFLTTETDEAKKKAYKEEIVKLYSECVSCYEQKMIEMTDCDDDCYNSKIGFISGRMGYDMYYNLNSPYAENLAALMKSIEYNGNTAEYIVLEPTAAIAIYQYQQKLVSAEELRKLYDQLNAIADYNIENDDKYAEYYTSGIARANNLFKAVEKEIFDCDYFKKKLLPMYEENPSDFENLKYVFNMLKQRGCSDSDPDLMKIKAEYEVLAKDYNDAARAVWLAENPQMQAKNFYDAGNYDEAINMYKKAIEKFEGDADKQAGYHFRIASIQGRKLNKYNDARKSALKAASMKPGWGQPYMLIGDLYAMTSRNCGDAWNRSLAVLAAIDKYAYAKSLDSSVSTTASSRIAKYNRNKPDKEAGFMQGLKGGESLTVGCWIGEKVRLRY